MRLKVFGLVAVIASTAAVPAWAHHSHGNYQMTDYVHIEGTVREFHFVNPHAWIYLEVMNSEGEGELWALEAGGVFVSPSPAAIGETLAKNVPGLA